MDSSSIPSTFTPPPTVAENTPPAPPVTPVTPPLAPAPPTASTNPSTPSETSLRLTVANILLLSGILLIGVGIVILAILYRSGRFFAA